MSAFTKDSSGASLDIFLSIGQIAGICKCIDIDYAIVGDTLFTKAHHYGSL